MPEPRQHRTFRRPRRPDHTTAQAASTIDPAADLRFIRDTMERSASFTAVPGWGQVILGATALIAAWFAEKAFALPNSAAWLKISLAEAFPPTPIPPISLLLNPTPHALPLFP